MGDTMHPEKNWSTRGIILMLFAIATATLAMNIHNTKNKAYYNIGGRDLTVEETIEVFSDSYDRMMVDIVEKAEIARQKKQMRLMMSYFGVLVMLIGVIMVIRWPAKNRTLDNTEEANDA